MALAAAGVLARDPLGEVVRREGAPAAQRPLAGGTGGANPPAAGPVRVVLIDGLHRADAAALPTLDALCAGGLDLVVDVGFPTKSLPVQQVLWTGLTNQQLGARGDNLEVVPPPTALPVLVPGSVAAVESHEPIARSVGFARIVPLDDAAAEVAGAAPLVLVHVLGVDHASHLHGRGGEAHRAALAAADRVLAEVTAAAPSAQWLVLSDHGHVAGGGHGDAEDEVRRVRACWSPAPVAAPRGAEVHLVDVARWLADALGAPRHAHAQGRTLAVAVANPDRDATLPRPGAARTAIALVLLGLGLAASLVASRTRVTALWPLAAALVIAVAHGMPTLSHRAPTLLLLFTGASLACIALVVEERAAAPSLLRLVFTSLGWSASLVLALAVVTGLPQALAGGVAPRLPGWTGLLAAALHVTAGAMAGTGSFLALGALLRGFRE